MSSWDHVLRGVLYIQNELPPVQPEPLQQNAKAVTEFVACHVILIRMNKPTAAIVL